jgi:predicted nuclease with TOPRIM domain
MRIKNVVYLFGLLLLFSGFVYRAEASSINSVSFHGVGVTIDLAFPEEAHPAESITHNLTITANTVLTLNFTIIIYAPVNSSWQEVQTPLNLTNFPLQKETSLPILLSFNLPQQANGTLKCFIYVLTDQSADYSSYTFYTTDVRTLTYNELLSEYTELLANYTTLQGEYNELSANYSELLSAHNELLANYNSLLADYATLLDSYNLLLIQYETLNSTYNLLSVGYGTLNSTYTSLSVEYDTLNSTYNVLLGKNNVLQSDYNSLNSTHYSLQTNYNSLDANYNVLLGQNNVLHSDYNSLEASHNVLLGKYDVSQSNYDELNSTQYDLQTNYNSLRVNYTSLNQLYTALENDVNDLRQRIEVSEKALSSDQIVMAIFTIAVGALVALIAYIKRKKPEPYVVIRKETVSLKPGETS